MSVLSLDQLNILINHLNKVKEYILNRFTDDTNPGTIILKSNDPTLTLHTPYPFKTLSNPEGILCQLAIYGVSNQLSSAVEPGVF